MRLLSQCKNNEGFQIVHLLRFETKSKLLNTIMKTFVGEKPMLCQTEMDHHLQYTKKNLLLFHKIVVGFSVSSSQKKPLLLLPGLLGCWPCRFGTKTQSISDHFPLLVCSVTIISKTSHKKLDHFDQN